MSTLSSAAAPSSGTNSSAFWERLWRTSGFQFVALSIVAYVIYANGDRTRMLVAATVSDHARADVPCGAMSIGSALSSIRDGLNDYRDERRSGCGGPT